MTVVAMSHGEISRFDTLMRVDRGELRVEDAATLLGVLVTAVQKVPLSKLLKHSDKSRDKIATH